jgi:hypothetical protein
MATEIAVFAVVYFGLVVCILLHFLRGMDEV